MSDSVNHPAHYTSSPAKCSNCGTQIECIQVTEHMSFSRGNAVKYLWRGGSKSKANEIEDLRKAIWYINREIANLEKPNVADAICQKVATPESVLDPEWQSIEGGYQCYAFGIKLIVWHQDSHNRDMGAWNVWLFVKEQKVYVQYGVVTLSAAKRHALEQAKTHAVTK